MAKYVNMQSFLYHPFTGTPCVYKVISLNTAIIMPLILTNNLSAWKLMMMGKMRREERRIPERCLHPVTQQ